ncbi:LytR C-terminal domain-containing protein [Streptantibioticus parmotrematis]|uniref:LytR C-terminal domain-containing protein n=1 Tax=Streptantibioticus parmotrematis TaxID=2873249 RepID=UPI0033F4ABFC
MSDQEQYGQEPYQGRDPYAPYSPGYPQPEPQGEGQEGYQGQEGYEGREGYEGYDPYAQHAPQQQYAQHQQYGGQPYPGQAPQGYPEQGQGYGVHDHAAYPGQGYDGQGYAGQGYPEQGYAEQQHPEQPHPAQGYGPQQGYPAQEYPAQEYPAAAQPSATVPQQRSPGAESVEAEAESGPPSGAPGAEGDFHTEEFAFVEEEDEQAEDVIDWLKFSESRTERRDERKRRGRQRVVLLVVVVALAVAGGVGYLWQSGRLPGLSAGQGAAAAAGAQKRDVIVVHLREVDSDDSSTALLVGNETTGEGTTVLLPNSLTLSPDSGTTTLAKSVVDDGAAPTRDGLNTLLGADIQGTWRLDTPYLEILVDAVGGITLDADATVASGGKTLVTAGKGQQLDGQAAVAYATYRAAGEPQAKQLARFGQVMQAVLMKMPATASAATKIVNTLGAIPDPSLSNAQLGATLAQLAQQAQGGHYRTTTLPVQTNGTLSEQATDDVVKNVLGGAVKNADPSGIPTIAVQNATGSAKSGDAAQVQVVNSGYTYVSGGTAAPRTASQVLYSSAAQKETAGELAKTLGLPASAVRQGQGAANAQITVVLGRDYHPAAGS